MGKVFVSVGISLDGFIAGPNRGPANPLGDRGAAIHRWVYGQQAFRSLLKLGGGGETGPDNDRIAATVARIGANVMGKRMFDEGERSWPEEAPFHAPVFVLTHERRAAWPRPGGTTFHFVDAPIASVVAQARAAAGDKDVRVSGGADVIRQALAAGLVDELELAIAPLLLGEGLRLFDGIDSDPALAIVDAVASRDVMHVRYAVKPR